MKKTVLTIALLLGLSIVAFAIPARPGARQVRQPDGTVITLTLHGDEFCHWVTDASGTIVEKGADGFWRPSAKTIEQHRTPLYRRSIGRRSLWSSYDTAPVTNFGDRKILAILMNFTDSTFVLNDPNTRFSNLLNQEGYSENGGHGSVRDYYIENSHGQYRPHFDVYGPVNLTNSSAYYDQKGIRHGLYEACKMLDDQINFADYDSDGNGVIDMILIYYAGHNEAEGAGSESIWPHKSTGYGTFDGVNIGNYFCTSELFGVEGEVMCGIGTTTHEFAHSLGLPDFYDTDAQNSGGYNGATNWYDVMCSGPYLDNGRRPPYFSAVERNMLGWMPEPEQISSSGVYTLAPVQENAAYKVLTENEGEYFVLESRNMQGWDYEIPEVGLLVYHVDQSQNDVNGYTASYLWENTNKINAFYGHPCYYLLTTTGDLPGPSLWDNMCFGSVAGGSGITLEMWSGEDVGMEIKDVAITGEGVVFQAIKTDSQVFAGLVTDTSDMPVPGVQVVLSKAAYPFAGAPSILPTDIVTTTDSSGAYSFSISSLASNEYVISFRKDGYATFTENVTIDGSSRWLSVTMFGKDEGPNANLYKLNPDGNVMRGGFGSLESIAVSMCYTADEIAQMGYAGATLNNIHIAVNRCTYSKAYLLVYFGSQLVLMEDIGKISFGAFRSYDISSHNLVIPEGEDVYIGYGLTGLVAGEYPFFMKGNGGTSAGGNYARKDFDKTNPSSWKTAWAQYDFMIFADVEFPAPEKTVASYDVAFISVEGGVPSAVPSEGKTFKDTTWYLDGQAVDTPPAVSALSPGSHTYKAVLRYYDGTSETVWYDIVPKN
ncbi:MAG: M6 family metalloprotease domain-containing protein [Bacteroidales bacterium]|nr:M6 family metalloprotease domain-containing protein [Bacteroidales bacterium]